jgi:leader peptidase (prepilin peptidase)/N-methyltransferase
VAHRQHLFGGLAVNPPLSVIATVGAFGVVVGSVLTMLIYRLPREEPLLWPSSHCPSCEHPLLARHTVPLVSWLVLRGRCAFCRARVSVRYPLVELGTGLLFAAITLRFGVTVQLPAYLFLAAVAVLLGLIEFDVRRLPDSIVLPSYVVSVLLLMPAGAAEADWRTATRGLLSMAALWLVFFVMALAYPHAVKMGDAKLAGLLGLYLGWLSWGTVLIGTFGAFFIAAVSTGTAAVGRRDAGVQAIPFAPCMVAAAVLALFVAVPITSWYGANVVPL